MRDSPSLPAPRAAGSPVAGSRVEGGVTFAPAVTRDDYRRAYHAVPYSRAEHLANPSYRHEAAMKFLTGEYPPARPVVAAGAGFGGPAFGGGPALAPAFGGGLGGFGVGGLGLGFGSGRGLGYGPAGIGGFSRRGVPGPADGRRRRGAERVRPAAVRLRPHPGHGPDVREPLPPAGGLSAGAVRGG